MYSNGPLDCPYRLTPEGVWVCPLCGHEYPRPVEPMPRRNCPKAPPAREATRRHVEARLAEKRTLGLCELSEAQTTARLETCLACPLFTGRMCSRIGGCDSQEKWTKKVACGDCEHWPERKAPQMDTDKHR